MNDLVRFLRAQLDDDERVARETTDHLADVWGWVELAYDGIDADVAFHDRFDPARVLAEVDAKRRILDLHDAMVAGVEAAAGTVLAGASKVRLGAYLNAVKCLALPYAGRPGYRDEWRP
jgi:hypothetical protein